ncbi:MAG: glycoside hydrolase family 127 protein [Butyrivibrio sp.]|nr:glycoside hydrolase family 127 protein [Butyrivibrio sp.]
MLTDTTRSPYAVAAPLPGEGTTWTKGFWHDVEETNANATIPELLHMFEDRDISHIVENFRICAGEAEGSHAGTVFGDGDFYKWLEAAMFTAAHRRDDALWQQIEGYIDLIGRAQQPDGYLSTKQILGEREGNGVHRMGDINDFEVYNFGHLFTVAALHLRLTGRDSLLRIASRTADYLDRMYEEARQKDEVQTSVCPSHYMGLVELYRATGDRKYLTLAHTAIALRDSVHNGLDDNQDRLPLMKHRRIIGHAVRANYLYAGLADLYLEEGDTGAREVLDAVWADLVNTKLYVTGGCGALYNGASPYGDFFSHQLVHQAYGYAYQLPNITAYNETCAGVGLVMWAYRMFQINPLAEYFDIIERAMLNTNLAAVSLDGLRFFYENMLERTKHLDYALVWPLHRTDYITSYCCPPNLARLLAQAGEYAYMSSTPQSGLPWTIYTGLYGDSRVRITAPCGGSFLLVQETDYPYSGQILLHAAEVEGLSQDLRLALRIPGWAESAHVTVIRGTSQHRVEITCTPQGHYEMIDIPAAELAECRIELLLEMPVRLTTAHPMVEEDRGRACVERGPLVYCLEAADTDGGSLQALRLPVAHDLTPVSVEIAGRQMTALKGTLLRDSSVESQHTLYRHILPEALVQQPVTLIPYFAWNNRQPLQDEEMVVFFPLNY